MAIAETLIVGAAPIALLGHVDTLHNLGVTGVINMCDEYCGPTNLYRKYVVDIRRRFLGAQCKRMFLVIM